jgi:hypothetical protein
MIRAKDAVIWVHHDDYFLLVLPLDRGRPEHDAALNNHYQGASWHSPIGATHQEWEAATDADRIRAMLEAAVYLVAVRGFKMNHVLHRFAEVQEFSESHLMREVTKATETEMGEVPF